MGQPQLQQSPACTTHLAAEIAGAGLSRSKSLLRQAKTGDPGGRHADAHDAAKANNSTLAARHAACGRCPPNLVTTAAQQCKEPLTVGSFQT
jgi:hypothetical protein